MTLLASFLILPLACDDAGSDKEDTAPPVEDSPAPPAAPFPLTNGDFDLDEASVANAGSSTSYLAGLSDDLIVGRSATDDIVVVATMRGSEEGGIRCFDTPFGAADEPSWEGSLPALPIGISFDDVTRERYWVSTQYGRIYEIPSRDDGCPAGDARLVVDAETYLALYFTNDNVSDRNDDGHGDLIVQLDLFLGTYIFDGPLETTTGGNATAAADATLLGDDIYGPDATIALVQQTAFVDVEGDGMDDVVGVAVLSPGITGGRTVFVLPRDVSGPVVVSQEASSLREVTGGIEGSPPFIIGEFDGDGYPDMLHASSYLVLGPLSTESAVEYSAEVANSFGGQRNAGDMNGDGLEDVLGLEAEASAAGYTGYGYIRFFIAPFSGYVEADSFYTGAAPGDYLGIAGAGVGDITGDGLSDVVVATAGGGTTPNYHGWVLLGN